MILGEKTTLHSEFEKIMELLINNKKQVCFKKILTI